MLKRALLALSLVLAPRPAAACGGCFGPPAQPTLVTGHRMAFAISETQTVLWDQFQYQGEPEDFSWVLP
jgi:glycogen synthase